VLFCVGWRERIIGRARPGGWVASCSAAEFKGDANDNAADIDDLLLLIAHYNKTQSTGGYLDAADFSGGGANDSADLLLLIGNYNQMGDS